MQIDRKDNNQNTALSNTDRNRNVWERNGGKGESEGDGASLTPDLPFHALS